MTNFFIDAGPYVLAAITLALFLVFVFGLARAAAKPCPSPLPRAPLAGSGSSGSPLGSLPVRADDFMAEFDAELERVVWEWSRS